MSAPRRPGPSRRVRVREVTAAGVREREDRLATEEPLEVRIAWPGQPAKRMSVTMRTPGNDFELVAGFLAAEGVIGEAGDLTRLGYCTDRSLDPEQRFNVVTAELVRKPRRTPGARYAGPGAGASACGVCGKQSIDEVLAVGCSIDHDSELTRQWTGTTVAGHVLTKLPETLRRSQRVFQATGGLHAAGLFDVAGTPLVVREDIGRHNAVDKVVGSRVLAAAHDPLSVLCVSGRIGFELVQKAVVAGVGVLAAVGAPSSLAVRLAAEASLCTVGFLRDERFVVYTVPDRVSA